jgi:hypothetical protein
MSKWFFMCLCFVLGSCGMQEESDCPDPIVQWEDGGPQPEPEPEPREEVPLSWDGLQPVLQAECMGCHQGDRSFQSERDFRNSTALDLIKTGAMPKGKALSAKGEDAFSRFFLVPVFQ